MKQATLKSCKILLALGIGLSTGISQANAPTTKSDDISSLASSSQQKIQEPFTHKDIHDFITTIAMIHHYYVEKTKNDRLFSDAIRGMVNSLDPHSDFLDAEAMKALDSKHSGKFSGIGIEIAPQQGLLKVISPIEGSPAAKADIKPDDLITEVDGTLVRDLTFNEAIKRIKGKKGTRVKLTIYRDNKPRDVTITRDNIKLTSVKSKLLDKKYGYIKISYFQSSVEKQLQDAVKKLQQKANNDLSGLVLDLRNNPGGLLNVSAEVADSFLDSKKIEGFDHKIVSTQGRIKIANRSIEATPGDLVNGIPIVVLINGGSASASEIVAGALQDYRRAIIMGTRSYGKGSVQTILPISDHSAIKLTTALYYTPAGRVIQARGIIPDIIVPALLVDNTKISNLAVKEADLDNHLLNTTAVKAKQKEMQQFQKSLDSQMKLAKKDYQLYQALVMLKGLLVGKS